MISLDLASTRLELIRFELGVAWCLETSVTAPLWRAASIVFETEISRNVAYLYARTLLLRSKNTYEQRTKTSLAAAGVKS